MRDDTFCSNQLRLAIGNDCDEDIRCGVALYDDGRYQYFRESTRRANTEAKFGFGSSGPGCNAGSGARWVVRCTRPDDPASCRRLPPD